MLHWNVFNISKNHYQVEKDNDFIEFTLDAGMSKDYDILFSDSLNMSNDNVIFVPDPHPTRDTDKYCIVGCTYRYEDKQCVEKGLAKATIINFSYDTLSKAKRTLDIMCL